MTYSPNNGISPFNSRRYDQFARVGRDAVSPNATPAWKLKISGKEFAGNTVFHSNLAIVCTELDTITAIELTSGKTVWQVQDKSWRDGTQGPDLACTGDELLVSSRKDDRGHLLDPQTGATIKVYSLENYSSEEAREFSNKFSGGPGGLPIFGDWIATETKPGHWEYQRSPGSDSKQEAPKFTNHKEHHLLVSQQFEHARYFRGHYYRGRRIEKDNGKVALIECRTFENITPKWETEIVAPDSLWKVDYSLTSSAVIIRFELSRTEYELIALNRADGKEIWRSKIAGDLNSGWKFPDDFWPSATASPTPADEEIGNVVLVPKSQKAKFVQSMAGQAEAGAEAAKFSEYSVNALAAYNGDTGELIWQSEDNLPCEICELARPYPIARPFARAGNFLWIIHTHAEKLKANKWGAFHAAENSDLVCIDYTSGKILHRQKIGIAVELKGQHAGNLLVRSGSSLICFR